MSVPHGELPAPDGMTPDFTHPKDVLYTVNQVSSILCIVLITPFVLIRLYIKAKILKSVNREDWTCLAAWIWSIAFLVCVIFQGHFGGGYREWEVTQEEFVGFGKSLYANTITYGPASYLTKVTLLLIVARVFSPFRKTVIFIYIFIFGMLGYYIPVLFIKIRVCTPISALWDQEIMLTARCFDQRAIFVADTCMSAITDIAVLIIPIPLVYTLQMSFKKRLRIMAMLGAGGIATGASVVRLVIVLSTNTSAGDETITFTRFNLLAVAEMGIGLICACLPAFNILFQRYASEPNSMIPSRSQQKSDVRLSNIKRSDKARRAALGLNSQSVYVEVGSDKDALFSNAMKNGGSIMRVDEVRVERKHKNSMESSAMSEEV